MSYEHDRLTLLLSTEASLRTLVEGMPQMIWRAVGLGSWTWSSPQWLRYTGQTPEQSSGWGWQDVVHPDDRANATESWQLADERAEFHADLRIRDRAGRYKWFQTRGEPVRDEDGTTVEWIGTSTDIDDLRQLQAEQKVLVAELQHRTRNLIAVVHSICMQTIRGTSSLEEFGDRFEDRLSALSRVQGLLSTSEHDPITIRRLLELELQALGADRVDHQIQLSGPDTIIRNSTAQTLALAVHELSTNALKYGALSSPTGKLDVKWHEHARDGRPWVQLRWCETSTTMPVALEPRRRGYGRELIEQALPRQLNARTNLVFLGDGVECVIDLPLKHYRTNDFDG
ncbi:MAG: PAS domain S-box protein [Oxalobacteraceae bacterium]|nr:MAG: PAS domain S-box protein [Oxalobacteraceae bacterium]